MFDVPHTLRRVQQTLTSFDNPLSILRGTARSRREPGRHEIEFRTRTGEVIVVPGSMGALVPIYEVFAENAYRLDWFTKGMSAEPFIVDVGAHVGSFSLAISSGRPGAKGVCYEVSPFTYSFLQRNLERNRPGQFTAFNKAVAGHAGELEIYTRESGSGLTGLRDNPGATLITRPAVALGGILEQGPATIDVVKIDTEGAEYDMITASRAEQWKGVQRVVIEYHEVDGRSWSELADFFGAAGFAEVAHTNILPRLGTVWLARDAKALT